MSLSEYIEEAKKTGSIASYSDDALWCLGTALIMTPIGGTVLEVGCQYGRSTTLVLLVAKERVLNVTLIDPFNETPESAGPFLQRHASFGIPFQLLVMTTQQAAERGLLPTVIDLVHIDGDHKSAGLSYDCRILLPRLRHAGIAVFHDYGNPGLPGVKKVVDIHIDDWGFLSLAGCCLVIRKS